MAQNGGPPPGLVAPPPLPPLQPLTHAALTATLCTLFESSPALHALLVPAVFVRVRDSSHPPETYTQLIDICADAASGWSYDQKADFISGHPMIGEVGNLSALSAREQASMATPKVVLDRLAHLNALYNYTFPGLRYITFVNGRPRAAIVNELERAIGLAESPSPLPADYAVWVPEMSSPEIAALRRDPAGAEWKAECDRAMEEVWRIGVARLKALGVENSNM